ncbi:MAG: hypothetical protein R3F60_15410 [bacterium]
MLHRVLIALALLLAGQAVAQPDARLRGLLTEGDRARLNLIIRKRQVEVRRQRSVPRGFTVPGGTLVTGRGWLAASRRVVTASALVEGWPVDAADVIEVLAPDGVWRPAAVGLIDARTGLAVLDVDLPPISEGPAAEKGALWPGRRVYAAGPSWPVELLVQARGAGDLRWYWVLAGPPLSPGTPLFDPGGNLISVVGLLGAGGVPLALPEESIADLRAREGDWLP